LVHDTESVSWTVALAKLSDVDLLVVEPGRISGWLARLLALLAVVTPYILAAQLAELLLGVEISAMGIWKVAQRLGESAARYSEGLSQYHADRRSATVMIVGAPATRSKTGFEMCRGASRRPNSMGQDNVTKAIAVGGLMMCQARCQRSDHSPDDYRAFGNSTLRQYKERSSSGYDRQSPKPPLPLFPPPPYSSIRADHEGRPVAQPELRGVPGLRKTV
jgi:hypothetical protein